MEKTMDVDGTNPHELSEDDFDALETLLTSDIVPADCMDLEVLDGYLAAVIASPEVISSERWLPGVWTAHADQVSFATGGKMQKVIRLVLAYYSEMTTTVGAPEGWEPFCYAINADDTIGVGEEWIEGFTQGLALWPADWATLVPAEDAEAVRAELDAILAPWEQAENAGADDETRLKWLAQACEGVQSMVARWRRLELPAPEPLALPALGGKRASEPGRNDPCSCGSGKKYKKCCGAAA